MDKNPLKVQGAPAGKTPKPMPLVLIHDGGGTVFGYFSLGKLYRDVYAISNPNYFTAAVWEGGMPEMARHYIGLISTLGLEGPIILGGWSLGGWLSLEMASILSREPSLAKFSVHAMLMIDSPLHVPLSQMDPFGEDPDFSKLPELVQKSLANCDKLLDKWELPSWDGPAYGGRSVQFTVAGDKYSVEEGSVLYKSSGGRWRNVVAEKYEQEEEKKTANGVSNGDAETTVATGLPPAALIRCLKYSTARKGDEEPCHVDRYREERFLGWDGAYPSFIKASIDTDIDHYNIFDFKHVRTLTQQIAECLQVLDTIKAVE